jgi:hypothetical protein
MTHLLLWYGQGKMIELVVSPSTSQDKLDRSGEDVNNIGTWKSLSASMTQKIVYCKWHIVSPYPTEILVGAVS